MAEGDSSVGGNGSPLPNSESRGYSTWEQVAGYFDGDGSPKVHVNVYTLTLTVSWSDKDIDIIQHINKFLNQRGIFAVIGKFRRGENVYYELQVSEGNGALLASKLMLPHLDKKWSQVNGAVNYLENRITGDEFIAVLNEAVRTKKRSSSLITRDIPYMKSAGKILRGGRPHMRSLTRDQVETIKHDKEVFGLSYTELAKIYKVDASTVFLSLKKYAWD